MNILSIETSCDETAAAIVECGNARVFVRSNAVSSQTSLHNKWGGVVPNLASREHIKNIIPVIEEAMAQASVKPPNIDLIAVTQGPGLMPALLIGVSAAKTLSLVWQKPLIGIHHLEGHIYSNFIGKKIDSASIFPLLALIVSGGHTQLVLMQKHFDYTVIGETQDDAAGEAFDKVAKLLGLPYPGGPEVAKRADFFRNWQTDSKDRVFPRPMINSNDFNFSFSGLKTAVLYFLKKNEEKIKDKKFIDEVCCNFQEAVADVLVSKTEKALKLHAPKTLVIAGGVSANIRLRERLRETVAEINLKVGLPKNNEITFFTPEFSYSLDNAAMIAIAAAFRYELMNEKQKQSLYKNSVILEPNANLAFSSI